MFIKVARKLTFSLNPQSLVIPGLQLGEVLDGADHSVQTYSQDDVLCIQDKAIYDLIPDVDMEDIKCLSLALQRLRLRRQRITDSDVEEN